MNTEGRRRVLVVDDDPKIIMLLSDFFGDRYDVDTALSGAAGLSAVVKQRPDIVLLDINMPGMTGIEVLKSIRRLDDKIPVIMVTASTDISAAEEALASGAFAYLPKPFQLQYADHLVAAALGESRSR